MRPPPTNGNMKRDKLGDRETSCDNTMADKRRQEETRSRKGDTPSNTGKVVSQEETRTDTHGKAATPPRKGDRKGHGKLGDKRKQVKQGLKRETRAKTMGDTGETRLSGRRTHCLGGKT